MTGRHSRPAPDDDAAAFAATVAAIIAAGVERFGTVDAYVAALASFTARPTVTQKGTAPVSTQPSPKAETRHDGWDAASRPRMVLVDPCGCTWTSEPTANGRHARLSVCSPCLSAAQREIAVMFA